MRPSNQARDAKSQQRSQYDKDIAQISSQSPVSEVIIKLRGAINKAAAGEQFTIENMDSTEQWGRQYWIFPYVEEDSVVFPPQIFFGTNSRSVAVSLGSQMYLECFTRTI